MRETLLVQGWYLLPNHCKRLFQYIYTKSKLVIIAKSYLSNICSSLTMKEKRSKSYLLKTYILVTDI